jgi:hypothetical protein
MQWMRINRCLQTRQSLCNLLPEHSLLVKSAHFAEENARKEPFGFKMLFVFFLRDLGVLWSVWKWFYVFAIIQGGKGDLLKMEWIDSNVFVQKLTLLHCCLKWACTPVVREGVR